MSLCDVEDDSSDGCADEGDSSCASGQRGRVRDAGCASARERSRPTRAVELLLAAPVVDEPADLAPDSGRETAYRATFSGRASSIFLCAECKEAAVLPWRLTRA
jgi:hypothetical protein